MIVELCMCVGVRVRFCSRRGYRGEGGGLGDEVEMTRVCCCRDVLCWVRKVVFRIGLPCWVGETSPWWGSWIGGHGGEELR